MFDLRSRVARSGTTATAQLSHPLSWKGYCFIPQSSFVTQLLCSVTSFCASPILLRTFLRQLDGVQPNAASAPGKATASAAFRVAHAQTSSLTLLPLVPISLPFRGCPARSVTTSHGSQSSSSASLSCTEGQGILTCLTKA